MADPQQRVAATDVEAIISRLRGVISVRVVYGDGEGISEIHVVADQTRSPKQLSRDIESAVLSELGIRIDHRKVSIAQLREEAEAEPTAEVRLKFLGIEYSVTRTSARARVVVGQGEDSFAGVASVPVGPELQQERLVARAAVAAIEEFARSSSPGNGVLALELGDFALSNGARSPFVTVMVRVIGPGGEEHLIGSALVRDDSWRAAAFAVLDAVNRRLPVLMA